MPEEKKPKQIHNIELDKITMGTMLIIEERTRQIEKEGWTPEHDAKHTHNELIEAAMCYAYPDTVESHRGIPPYGWPFEAYWWKPSKDKLRNLQIAGALIAAELDRLLASNSKERLPTLPVNDPIGTVHVAAQMVGNIQQCQRCGEMLIDYTNSMTIRGEHQVGGWAVGQPLTVFAGNPIQTVAGRVAGAVECNAKAN